MKIGVQTGFSGATPPELIAAFGRIAEERGFHSIWVPEHVIFFREYASRYPYSADGRIPGNPDGVMEPLTALTFVAAHTERIRLGTESVWFRSATRCTPRSRSRTSTTCRRVASTSESASAGCERSSLRWALPGSGVRTAPASASR